MMCSKGVSWYHTELIQTKKQLWIDLIAERGSVRKVIHLTLGVYEGAVPFLLLVAMVHALGLAVIGSQSEGE